MQHWVSYRLIEGFGSLYAFCSGGKYGFSSTVLKCRVFHAWPAVTLNRIKDKGGLLSEALKQKAVLCVFYSEMGL